MRQSESPRPSPSEGAIAAAVGTAFRQYGVLSWPQARAHGVRHCDVRRLRRSDAWGNPCPQVYSVRSLLPSRGTDDMFLSVVMAAQLAMGPRAFAGGETAARLWGMRGLRRWDGREVHMVIPARGTQRHVHGITLHSWNVPEEEVTTRGDRIRLTTPRRTLADLLPRVDRDTAVCLMDSSLNQRLIDDEDTEWMEKTNRGRRGCVNVRAWWPLADARAESPLETRVRLVCVDGGLPPTALQKRFTDRSGALIAVVDCWWEEQRLIGEADGVGPHSTPQALLRDRERQNALQLWHPDVRMVRFTWRDLERPGYILSSITRAGHRLWRSSK